jgi:hypothetical protein
MLLAAALVALHRPAEARPLAEAAVAALDAKAPNGGERAAARFVLARALWDAGDPAAARVRAVEAQGIFAALQRPTPSDQRAKEDLAAWAAGHSGIARR